MESKKNRRQFLKNTSLAALSVGVLSQTTKLQAKAIQSTEACEKTTLDLYGQGPFYTENAPVIEDNKLAATNESGTPLIISGRVFNLDCSKFIPNTKIDIWHANDAGQYDNAGFNLRGVTYSNDQGFYVFETILPGKYLNDGQFRPSHIHFKITPPGFEALTTQLYFEGDTSIPADDAASVTSGEFDATHRIITLTENEGKQEGVWDINIDGNGEEVMNGLNNIHIDKGIIYEASPNPFSGKLVIKYGVFKAANIALLVFDANGNEIANVEERKLGPDKYEAEWIPGDYMPSGHYFIVLKVNDLQVHYYKVVRM